VKDVPAPHFISALAEHFKKSDKLELPPWHDIVKTGVHKDLPPNDPDWYYTRAASILRKLFLRPGVGVGDLANIYVDVDGKCTRTINRDLVALFGIQSVIGRSILVHELYDDCSKDYYGSGHAGARHALGVIGIDPSINNTASAGPDITALNVRLNPVTGETSQVTGDIYFKSNGPLKTIMYARIVGLTAGLSYGISIRSYGDMTSMGDTIAGQATLQAGFGPVLDPFGTTAHGLPTEAVHKLGDLGNVVAAVDGQVYFVTTYLNLPLASLAARGFVLHQNPDLGSAGGSDGGVGSFKAVGVIGAADLTKYPVVVLDHYSASSVLSVSFTLLFFLAAIGFLV